VLKEVGKAKAVFCGFKNGLLYRFLLGSNGLNATVSFGLAGSSVKVGSSGVYSTAEGFTTSSFFYPNKDEESANKPVDGFGVV
jgi:hypothetical protein